MLCTLNVYNFWSPDRVRPITTVLQVEGWKMMMQELRLCLSEAAHHMQSKNLPRVLEDLRRLDLELRRQRRRIQSKFCLFFAGGLVLGLIL